MAASPEDTFKGELDSLAEGQAKFLFVNFLSILEDLKRDHDNTFFKLAKNHPELVKTLDVCDYFDEDKMKHLRKKVLDLGNESMRDTKRRIEVKVNFRNKD